MFLIVFIYNINPLWNVANCIRVCYHIKYHGTDILPFKPEMEISKSHNAYSINKSVMKFFRVLGKFLTDVPTDELVIDEQTYQR